MHIIDNARMDKETARHYLLGKITAREDGTEIVVQKAIAPRHSLHIFDDDGEYVAMDRYNNVHVDYSADLNKVIELAKKAVIELEIQASEI